MSFVHSACTHLSTKANDFSIQSFVAYPLSQNKSISTNWPNKGSNYKKMMKMKYLLKKFQLKQSFIQKISLFKINIEHLKILIPLEFFL